MKKENKVNIFFAKGRFLQFQQTSQQAILFWFFFVFNFCSPHRTVQAVLMFFMFQRAKSCSNGGED
jgi:hypothetical protein